MTDDDFEPERVVESKTATSSLNKMKYLFNNPSKYQVNTPEHALTYRFQTTKSATQKLSTLSKFLTEAS